MSKKVDIFISYAREDQEQIQPLVRFLESKGWSVFWDQYIRTGNDWRKEINAALDNADCVIVAWSCNSIESNWVNQEAEEGKGRGVLIPILLDSAKPPLGFRNIQTTSLPSLQPEHYEQLVPDIEAILSETATDRMTGDIS